jgi:hypothetical protein
MNGLSHEFTRIFANKSKERFVKIRVNSWLIFETRDAGKSSGRGDEKSAQRNVT